MKTYFEQENGNLYFEGMVSPARPSNVDYQNALEGASAGVAEIIPFDRVSYDLVQELAEAIAMKQKEVREFYKGLHGEGLESVALRLAAPSPSIATAAAAATNVGIANGGIAAIASLTDKATVDSADVSGLAWV